jgi:hypothetical protein
VIQVTSTGGRGVRRTVARVRRTVVGARPESRAIRSIRPALGTVLALAAADALPASAQVETGRADGAAHRRADVFVGGTLLGVRRRRG